MKCKYYIENEHTLIKIDFEKNIFDIRNIDEHTLKCEHVTKDVDNAVEFFDLLKNTCEVPYKEITKDKYLDILIKFSTLSKLQSEIIKLKMLYAEQIKEYLNLFD